MRLVLLLFAVLIARQLHAAGDYPTVGSAGQGLPNSTAANRRTANSGIVAWLTVGFHQVARPEGWLIVPVAPHSVEIRPVGFFPRDPSMGLPNRPENR